MFYLLLHNGLNMGVWDVFGLPNILRQELRGGICFRPPTAEVLLKLVDSGLQCFLLRLQVPHSGHLGRENQALGPLQRALPLWCNAAR